MQILNLSIDWFEGGLGGEGEGAVHCKADDIGRRAKQVKKVCNFNFFMAIEFEWASVHLCYV